MEINVYEQYFEADLIFNGVQRKGALVSLQSKSEQGKIRYFYAVTFFPHRDEEDYAISYDAYFEKTIYEGKGRRSKKKEERYLEQLKGIIDQIIPEDGKIFWDKPLRQARFA